MSYSHTQYTQDQVAENYKAAATEILPAKIANTQANHLAITGYFAKHDVPPTKDSFIAAFKTLLRSLEWAVKPAQLLVLESADKPVRLENQRTIEQERHEKIKALEQRDKVLAKNAATEKLIEAAIAAYFPVNRMGRPSLPKREAEQARLRAYVKHEIARNADRKSILVQLNKEIERLYAEEALVNERL